LPSLHTKEKAGAMHRPHGVRSSLIEKELDQPGWSCHLRSEVASGDLTPMWQVET
jgi:hypothetical protein